jgi:acyl dehydratase
MPAQVIASREELDSLVGQEVGVSDWFEVSQARINDFAETTEDRQWIHLDVERARAESPYGTTIAHGFLTLSLISHLAAQAVSLRPLFRTGINYGLNRVRFPAAVPAGSRIRARLALQSVEDIPGGIHVIWNVTVEVEGGQKPALVAEWLVRYYR